MFTVELVGAADFCRHIAIGRRHSNASPQIW